MPFRVETDIRISKKLNSANLFKVRTKIKLGIHSAIFKGKISIYFIYSVLYFLLSCLNR